jgi:hypothetical protein
MEEFKIEDFFDNFPSRKEEDFNARINAKKDYSILNSNGITSGGLYNYQEVIRRYMSPETLNDRMMLVHAPGAGKSYLSLIISSMYIDGVFKLPKDTIKDNRVLIIVKGDTIKDNFIRDLEKINPKLYASKLSDTGHRTKSKNIDKHYDIRTYEKFSKTIRNADEDTLKRFSNRLVIVDEVHNLRKSEETETKKNYDNMSNFFDGLVGCKFLFLSATPMVDNTREFIAVMNLLLPKDDKISWKVSLDVNLNEIDKLLQFFEPKLRGRISWIEMDTSIASVIWKGEALNSQFSTKIVKSEMSDMQYKAYLNSKKKTIRVQTNPNEKPKSRTSPFSLKPRQSSNIIFPDSSFGKEGYRKYITNRSFFSNPDNSSKWLKRSQNFSHNVRNNELPDGNLHKLSTKMNTIIKELEDYPKEVAYIFTNFVKGSGANAMGRILKANGYSEFIGNNIRLPTKAKRYAFITSEMSDKQIRNIIMMYNRKENRYGDYLRVVIGSVKSGEGISFLNVRQYHEFDPFWNAARSYQARFRALRTNSHKEFKLQSERYVKMYRHAAVYKDVETIDLHIYKTAEEKDANIRNIIYVIKRIAFDCNINKYRNMTKEKYECVGIKNTISGKPIGYIEPDYSTYLIHHFVDEMKVIKKVITNLFMFKDSYSIQSLIKLTNRSVKELIISINDMILNRELVKNRFGFHSVIKEDNNIFYIDRDLEADNIKNNMLKNYSQRMTFSEGVNFKQYIKENVYTKTLVNFVRDFGDEEHERKLLFNDLTFDQKTYILEECLILNAGIPADIIEWILDILSHFWYIIEDSIIHIMNATSFDKSRYNINLTELRENSELKILDDKDGQWKVITENNLRYINIINGINNRKDDRIMDQYGILIVYNTADQTYRVVRKLVTKTRRDDKLDLRSKAKGATCKNLNKSILVNYCWQFRLNMDILKMKTTQSLSSMKAKIKTMITNNEPDEIKIKYMYLMSSFHKKDLCDLIIKHFSDLNAIRYK